MTRDMRIIFWLSGFVVTGVLVHLLADVLLPFVAAMAVAYFLDPVADRLEARGFSRTMATTLITVFFFALVIALLVVIFPLLQGQIVALVKLLPEAIDAFRRLIEPYLADLQQDLDGANLKELGATAGQVAGRVLKWITTALASLWSGGMALLNLISLLVITPVVSFYLLRDWDKIVALVDDHLPLTTADTIRTQAKAIDDILAGFVRGQASVCLVLALFYGVSLSLVGLKSGLLVGLGAGLISFIPYIGATSGIIVALAIAFFQFGLADPVPIALVGFIFIVGQVAESYVLTPRLVGDKVGLHPVWIIFALMAGGALFGFTGMLLAVPVAAVIGVLLRFGLGEYKDSALYHGSHPDDPV